MAALVDVTSPADPGIGDVPDATAAPAVQSAPGVNSSGEPMPEGRITYADDGYLGRPLPALDGLRWLQGEEAARAALARPTVRVLLFWAASPKAGWHAIQQCEKLAQRHPAVQFLGVSCEHSLAAAEALLHCHAQGADHRDVNLYQFRCTFPAAFDPGRRVHARLEQLGGGALAPGTALVVDAAGAIVWKEQIDLRRLASSSDAALCMRYWSGPPLRDCQLPDQLRLLARGAALVSNGARPASSDGEEEVAGDVVIDDPFGGDY